MSTRDEAQHSFPVESGLNRAVLCNVWWLLPGFAGITSYIMIPVWYTCVNNLLIIVRPVWDCATLAFMYLRVNIRYVSSSERCLLTRTMCVCADSGCLSTHHSLTDTVTCKYSFSSRTWPEFLGFEGGHGCNYRHRLLKCSDTLWYRLPCDRLLNTSFLVYRLQCATDS